MIGLCWPPRVRPEWQDQLGQQELLDRRVRRVPLDPRALPALWDLRVRQDQWVRAARREPQGRVALQVWQDLPAPRVPPVRRVLQGLADRQALRGHRGRRL